MKIEMSKRSSVPLDLNPIATALAGRTRPPLDLTCSNPTRAGFDVEPPNVSMGSINPYRPDPRGPAVARRAIAQTYADLWQAQVHEDDIVITASTSEGYSYVLKALCDPGDEVLVPNPAYPLIEHLCRLENVTAKPYRLFYDGGSKGTWNIDFDALLTSRSSRTKAVILVAPNNPTGSYIKETEQDQLFSLDLPIVVDEVFAPYPLEFPKQSISTFAHARRDIPVITLNGLSKLIGMPQLKIGWLTVNHNRSTEKTRLIDGISLIADMYLSANTITMEKLDQWLLWGKQRRSLISNRLTRNLGILDALLDQHPAVSRLRVEGGWSAVLRLPALLTDEAWALHFLNACDVLVQPGYFYDLHEMTAAVISLLTPEDLFEQGCKKILSSVQSMC